MKILFKYVRISIEDGDESKDESQSIVNQRILLDSYIAGKDEFSDYEIREYCDDGYSGTNMKRPGLQALLAEIKKVCSGCILVKDFSRFSRDYVELGNFLEQIFPFVGIRFIAVNDGYDSADNRSNYDSLLIPAKGILYSMYSRDISNKVKSSIRHKTRQGKISVGSHPFGYLKSGLADSPYIIDEEAAQIVRLIFDLALEGKSNIEIAKELNAKNIITPGLYKKSKGFHGYGVGERTLVIWDTTKVIQILRDERYAGTLVVGKRQSLGVGCGKVVKMPRELWIRRENSHPAIVSKSEFEQVEDLRKPYQKKGKYQERHILFGMVKCQCCGHNLYHKPSESGAEYHRFYCKTPHLDKESKCFQGYIKENEILKLVAKKVKQEHAAAVRQFTMEESDKKLRKSVYNSQAERLEKDLAEVQKERMELYEQFKEQKIKSEEYRERKEQLSVKVKCLKERKADLDKHEEEKVSGDVHSGKEIQGTQQLTREIIQQFVSEIGIDSKGMIDIKKSN